MRLPHLSMTYQCRYDAVGATSTGTVVLVPMYVSKLEILFDKVGCGFFFGSRDGRPHPRHRPGQRGERRATLHLFFDLMGHHPSWLTHLLNRATRGGELGGGRGER